jgi:hypothetical protein
MLSWLTANLNWKGVVFDTYFSFPLGLISKRTHSNPMFWLCCQDVGFDVVSVCLQTLLKNFRKKVYKDSRDRGSFVQSDFGVL